MPSSSCRACLRARRVQAWCRALDAVDISRGAAVAAHHVMVVVAGSGLVQRGAAGGLDPPGEPDPDQGGERVVDGLAGDRTESSPYELGDLVDPQVARSLPKHGQHRDPLDGAPQRCSPDVTLWLAPSRHVDQNHLNLRTSQVHLWRAPTAYEGSQRTRPFVDGRERRSTYRPEEGTKHLEGER
jgi:hypothetical protein